MESGSDERLKVFFLVEEQPKQRINKKGKKMKTASFTCRRFVIIKSVINVEPLRSEMKDERERGVRKKGKMKEE